MGARIERSNTTMLGMKPYSKNYIDACRARVDASLRAYPKTGRQSAVQGVRAAFLQRSGPPSGLYVRAPAHGHRRKGWDPLNEVRVLCNSILLNQGKLQVDKLPGWANSAGSGIKLPPEKSLLKLKVGEEVGLTEADFVRPCEAFFEKKVDPLPLPAMSR